MLLIGLGWPLARPAAASLCHHDSRGAELLFQVLTEREEKASIAVASNAPFSEWGQTFTDPRLAAAIVDRLTFNALIVETGSESYRLRATRSRKKGSAPSQLSHHPTAAKHRHTQQGGPLLTSKVGPLLVDIPTLPLQ